MDPLLNNLHVDIHVADQRPLLRTWRASDSRQPFARLYHVRSGRGYLYHHDRRYALEADSLYIIPSLTPLTYACEKPLHIQWTHFNARLRNGIDLFQYLACDYQVASEDAPWHAELFQRLIALHGESGSHRQLQCTGLMLQLLAPFVATADPERRQQVLRFQRVLTYIDEHLAESIPLARLADLAHLEPTYFSALFSRHFGAPPLRYIHQRRIERALNLLWNSDSTLARVAELLGYTDAFHFSRTFKKITGITPADFRHQRRFPQP